jgi:hypothetical protein
LLPWLIMRYLGEVSHIEVAMLAVRVGCFRRGRYALGGWRWAEAPGM